jgi:hypothetical protein
MKILIGIAALLLLLSAAVVGFVYSGLFNVAATQHESTLVHWLLETTRKQAVRRRAAGILVPTLSDPRRVRAGTWRGGQRWAGAKKQ